MFSTADITVPGVWVRWTAVYAGEEGSQKKFWRSKANAMELATQKFFINFLCTINI